MKQARVEDHSIICAFCDGTGWSLPPCWVLTDSNWANLSNLMSSALYCCGVQWMVLCTCSMNQMLWLGSAEWLLCLVFLLMTVAIIMPPSMQYICTSYSFVLPRLISMHWIFRKVFAKPVRPVLIWSRGRLPLLLAMCSRCCTCSTA